MKCQIFVILSSALWMFVDSCTTPLGRISQCVSLYDCATLLAAFETRPLRSDIVNFLRQSQCGFEGYTPRVCCGPLPNQQATTPPPRPKPTSRPVTGRVDPTSSEDSSLSTRCGVDTTGDKIFNGQITELDEFPWMALLGYRTPKNTLTYQCGGVLINRRYVMTAAHCVVGAINEKVGTLETVRLGEYDTQSDVDCSNDNCADPVQEIKVLQPLPHSGFSDRNQDRQDDIALLRLAQRATFSYYVQPVCLVSNNFRLAVGNDVFVAGWGKTLTGSASPIKLKLSLPVFNKEECKSKYRTLNVAVSEKQICAGGVFAKDSCTGDSGGPLMRKRTDGVWEAVAVVSFGNGCGKDGWPGVYTNVASYIDWIKSTIRSSNV